jgi:hypothetical protein
VVLVRTCLLLRDVPSSGLRGFFLQGQMHAFMTAVLLGMARFDPFNADAEPQPPDSRVRTCA